MKTATYIPETVDWGDDSVKETLTRSSLWSVSRDAFLRFRFADGFSYARAMALQAVLALIPGLIFIVAAAARTGQGRFRSLLSESISSLAPGPASDLLLAAFRQGAGDARTNLIAITLGGLAAVASGAAAMAQLQRGGSRIYGFFEDRPTHERYGRALLLTLVVGTLMSLAFVLLVVWSSFEGALKSELLTQWTWARWPLGILLLTLALGALFKAAPNRDQPQLRWLLLGGAVAALGWLIVSVTLSLYLNASTAFGETYGPLAGFIGVMLWAQLSSIAIFYGLSVAAQVEALRAGVLAPTTDQRPHLAGSKV